jgi:flagellar motor switch protein FliN/FliY
MSVSLPQLAQAVAARFVGVLQSVVTPAAEAAPLEGAVTPGWLVPCELSGSLVGTWYLAIASDDAARLAARVLMKDAASPAEIGEALKELIAQAAADIGQAAPFIGLSLQVGRPATAPVAPGSPAGGFACRLDDGTSVRVGCSYAGGAATPVPGPTAAMGAAPAAGPRHAATPGMSEAPSAHLGSAPDNLKLILDIDMPLTVRFGEAVLTIEALSRLGPGSLVELSRQPDDPVDVLINGRLVARGEVVVVGGNYGVRVTEVASAVERIRTLNA